MFKKLISGLSQRPPRSKTAGWWVWERWLVGRRGDTMVSTEARAFRV